jgi:hypothetical protein
VARLEQQLARAAAGDFPPEALRVVAPDVSPDGRRAGALVLYNTAPEETPFEAFFEHEDGEWVERGQTDGPGAGGWHFGDVAYPYLSGRAEGAAVDLRLGHATIRRPVVDGWFIGVFWELADDEGIPKLWRTIN